MADTVRLLSPISTEEYLALERASEFRHELIDGVMYATAGGSENDNTISAELVSVLVAHLPIRCRAFNGDMKLRVHLENLDKFYYPDCAVFCGPSHGKLDWRDDPLVLGEVMSPSTQEVDRSEKLPTCTTSIPSLQEFVLIEQDRMQIEVYRRSTGWVKEVLGATDTLRLDSIAFEIGVSALYRRVEF